MAVTARASGKDFVAGKPAVILEADYLEFDVAPEGQRFIVLRRDPAAQPPELQGRGALVRRPEEAPWPRRRANRR